MIRINLLKGRNGAVDRLPPALDAEGPRSKFLTKREVLLAVGLVLVGGALIGAQLSGIFEEEVDEDAPLVGIYENPNGPPPARAASPEPEPVPVEPAVEAEVIPVEEPASEPVAPPEPEPLTSAPIVAAVTPTPAPQPAPPPIAAGSAPTVTDLRLTPAGQSVEILAAVAGAPEYNSFWLSEPARLVLDIEGANLGATRSNLNQTEPHPLIRQLRVAQNSVDPPRVRIVLEASEELPVQITATAEGISVKVSPAQ